MDYRRLAVVMTYLLSPERLAFGFAHVAFCVGLCELPLFFHFQHLVGGLFINSLADLVIEIRSGHLRGQGFSDVQLVGLLVDRSLLHTIVSTYNSRVTLYLS